MKLEEQRIAIAEACGWKPRHHVNGYYRNVDEPFIKELPDYLNDLNAMHEAEKIFTEKQQLNYVYVLNNGYHPDMEDAYKMLHATAAQRAEAFLKTLDLWAP